jgi:hypothetical protein
MMCSLASVRRALPPQYMQRPIGPNFLPRIWWIFILKANSRWSGQSRFFASCLWRREGAQDRLRLLGDDGEQPARRAVATAPALLPGVERCDVEAEGTREGGLREAKAVANLGNVHLLGDLHRVGRQFQLVTRTGERIMKAGDYSATERACLALRAPRRPGGSISRPAMISTLLSERFAAASSARSSPAPRESCQWAELWQRLSVSTMCTAPWWRSLPLGSAPSRRCTGSQSEFSDHGAGARSRSAPGRCGV